MSEMVQRVATAMAISDGDYEASDYWRRRARAAIEAMREPTEAMCDAAAVADPQSIRELWQAMIDGGLGKSYDH